MALLSTFLFTKTTTDPNPDRFMKFQTQGINKCGLRVMRYEKQVITFIVAINNITTISITNITTSSIAYLMESLYFS